MGKKSGCRKETKKYFLLFLLVLLHFALPLLTDALQFAFIYFAITQRTAAAASVGQSLPKKTALARAKTPKMLPTSQQLVSSQA